jgi:hypothetical protein
VIWKAEMGFRVLIQVKLNSMISNTYRRKENVLMHVVLSKDAICNICKIYNSTKNEGNKGKKNKK